MQTLINAYNNGWRCGASEPILETVNGLKYIRQATCPFTGQWQIVQRWLWSIGACNGVYYRLAK